jgi:uncharacterized protein YgbK (DUF1537 family)
MTGTAHILAWYGDDFTGAAAVMEVMEFSGFPSVLFLDPPTPDLLARFSGRQCVGIAGDARTRGPDWMRATLPSIFTALRATGAGMVHYKMCSTLDSAPEVGSVGCAAEIGLGSEATALMVVAAPRIGRWQVFGTLFARHAGGVARLDRHPTVSRHPVTPMHEADVRLHLARQTDLPMGLVDILDLQSDATKALARERAKGARIITVDLMDASSLEAVGRLLRGEMVQGQIFVIGSQGVEDAFVAAAIAEGHVLPAPCPAGRVDRIVVGSGSCSPETAQQIALAEADGFAVIPLNAALAVDQRSWRAACAFAEEAAFVALKRGQSVILASARGPDDPSIPAAREARTNAGLSARDAAETLGSGIGDILARLRERGPASRFAVAGGDTSSFATRAFGAVALTAEAEIAPAVPLLKAHFPGTVAACDWIVKGGQMGPEDLFVRMRDGVARSDPEARFA